MGTFVTNASSKTKKTAVLLCLFGGMFGLHYFYVGRYGRGILYFFTGGLLGFGWLFDIIVILTGGFKDRYGNYLVQWGTGERRKISKRYTKEYIPAKEPEKEPLLYNKNFDMMDGHEFEYFCADLLKRNGFENVEVTKGSGDHGVDILAEKEGVTYAIQCKCYSSNIGNAAIQQVHTGKSLYHKDVAIVMTNRYFTAQAKEEAKSLLVKLWDRDKILEMGADSNNQIYARPYYNNKEMERGFL